MKDTKETKLEKILKRYNNEQPTVEANCLILDKRLTSSERSRNYIHASSIVNYLPKANEKIIIRRRNNEDLEVETYLDNYGRIRLGSIGFRELEINSNKLPVIKIYTTNDDSVFELELIYD